MALDLGRLRQRAEGDAQEFEQSLAPLRQGGLDRLSHAALEELYANHRRLMGTYARVHARMPDSQTARRLVALAREGHARMARVEPPLLRQLWRYFWISYPQAFRRELPALQVSGAAFLGFVALGLVLGTLSEDFLAAFFSPEAISEARHGRIWTDEVEDRGPAAWLSSEIFTNNLSVCLIAWAGGLPAGLGTLYILWTNGMMVGAMFALAWRFDLFDRLFAFISTHGPLELFLIVLSCAAGLLLGRGSVEDRGRPRAELLADAGARSWSLVGGALPWIVLCGVIEGFISPNMDVPTPTKAAIGLALLGLFLAYALRKVQP